MASHRVKRKIKKNINKYLDFARKLKKNVEVKVIPIVEGALGTVSTGGSRNQKENQDHRDYSIAEIVWNTENSPGGLRRLAVTQIQVKDHQLTWV